MGRSIMALIERELLSVFGESPVDEVSIFAGRAEEQLAERDAHVGAREREANTADESLRRQDERLRLWEEELEGRERRAELASRLAARPRGGQSEGRSQRPTSLWIQPEVQTLPWCPLGLSRRLEGGQMRWGNREPSVGRVPSALWHCGLPGPPSTICGLPFAARRRGRCGQHR